VADYALAQTSVIGSMLIDDAVIGRALTQLKPEDFGEPLARETFQAIRDLYIDCEAIDPVMVLKKLGASKERRAYLLGAMDVTPTANNVDAYISIVRDEAKIRRVRELGMQLAECCDLEAQRALVGQAGDLLSDRSGVRAVNMEEAIVRFYERIAKPPVYVKWGYDFLDEGLYCEPGDLVVLGGHASDGKTALALTMAYAQAKTQRVGFFSLETNENKLFDRIFSAAAKVDNRHIKLRQLTEDDSAALAAKTKEVRDRDLNLVHANGMTVEDIRIYALARRFEIIYVDYLQLIAPSNSREVRHEQVAAISRGLHNLAQDSGITVVALSQLSRSDRTRADPEPQMRDLRESGQIEQDADIIMIIYREEPGAMKSRRILTVKKNKEGELGKWPLRFRGENQTFIPDLYVPIKEPKKPKEPPAQVSFTDLRPTEETPFD